MNLTFITNEKRVAGTLTLRWQFYAFVLSFWNIWNNGSVELIAYIRFVVIVLQKDDFEINCVLSVALSYIRINFTENFVKICKGFIVFVSNAL